MAKRPLNPSSLADQIEARSTALTVPELADLLGYAAPTIHSYIRDKQLPAIRIGRSYRLDPQITAHWLRQQQHA